MSVDIYQRILDQLKLNQFKGRISYDFYNEPLLCPNIDLFVELTRQQLPACEIHLYSNGNLLSLKRFKKLRNIGISWFVITKQEQEIEGQYLFDQTYLELSEDDKKIVCFRSYKDLHLTNRGGVLTHIKGKHEDLSAMPCLIPSMMLTITVKGNVLPCFEDFYQKYQMGNIAVESLEEIWNKPDYIAYRKKLALGFRKDFSICSTCTRVEVMPYKKTLSSRPSS
jgi:radical SAM protein with 4Fe4S-binding SPASM domain